MKRKMKKKLKIDLVNIILLKIKDSNMSEKKKNMKQ